MSAAADSKVIADTNILLYCFDETDAAKHTRASSMVEELLTDDRLILSVQILNEFYWNVTRPKRKIELPPGLAEQFVRELIQAAEILPLWSTTALLAIACRAKHQLQYWDALIWAAAKERGVPVVYSEDFQHNREIDGVRFINPFVNS